MSQSTRLENFRWTPEGARFEAGGRPVDLRSQDHPSALAAAQAFYQEALSAYPSGAVVAPERKRILPDWMRPSLWTQKIRSLFARVLSHATGIPHPTPIAGSEAGARPTTPHGPVEEASKATASPAMDPVKPAVRPPEAKAARPVDPARASTARAMGAAVESRTPSRTTREAQGEREVVLSREDADTDAEGPQLRAAFADAAGVHVIWAEGGDGRRPRETELLYSFDSPVAARLQGCYRGLADLGYDVVDLRVWRKEAEVSKESAQAPRKEAAATKAAVPKAEEAQIMRLHPEPGDTPGRAIVSPMGDEKNLQVITAPEKLVNALHAAADPKRPAEDRVTHLRCATSRGALKVIAVGMGENKEDPGAPGRWENISTWWEQAKKEARVAEAPAPVAMPIAASKVGREPELF